MMAVDDLMGTMPLNRACNLVGIPRRTYYNRKQFRIRIVNTRITLRCDNGDQYTSHYFMERVKVTGFTQEFTEKLKL